MLMKYYKILGLAPDSQKGDDAIYRCLDSTGMEVRIHKQSLVMLWKCERIIVPERDKDKEQKQRQ